MVCLCLTTLKEFVCCINVACSIYCLMNVFLCYMLHGQEALSKANFENYSSRVQESLSCWIPDSIGFNLLEAVLCYITRKECPGAVLVFMTGWEDISCLRDQLKAHPLLGDPNRVLLLTCHGSMATSEQVP